MSSKMRAGLTAGGFGAALYIALILSFSFSSFFVPFLLIALFFGLGVLAGALAAAWLDLADYGDQPSAGAFAGFIAAGVTELCDLVLRLVLAAIGKSSPTNVISNLLISRLPLETRVAFILFLIVINLVLYIMYLLIVVSISTLAAGILGRAKNTAALAAMMSAQEQSISGGRAALPVEELLDPALLPFQRPEYSPFINDSPPLPLPPWQRRRLEREGKLNTLDNQADRTDARAYMGVKPTPRLRLPTNPQRPKQRGKE